MEESGPRVLALHLSKQGGERIRELVSASPVAELAGLETSLEEFERRAIQIEPEIIVVEYDPEKGGLSDLLGRLRSSVPASAVIALSQSRDSEHILTAMRLGVREYLAEPASVSDFNAALLRLKRQARAADQAQGRMIAVVGVKGGAGASHLSLNLAWSMSQDQAQRVALADLDMGGGDLGFMLDVEPKRNLTDVAQNFDRVDALFLDSLLTEVAPGFHLLAGPGDVVAAEDVTGEHVSRALDHLAEKYGLVIMDIPSHLNEISLLALDRAELVILILEPTVVGLKAAQRWLSLGKRLGYDEEKFELIVNRFDTKGAVSRHEVESVMRRKVMAWLPNDTKAVMGAANVGRPVLSEWPRSPWSRAVTRLAKGMLNSKGGAK